MISLPRLGVRAGPPSRRQSRSRGPPTCTPSKPGPVTDRRSKDNPPLPTSYGRSRPLEGPVRAGVMLPRACQFVVAASPLPTPRGGGVSPVTELAQAIPGAAEVQQLLNFGGRPLAGRPLVGALLFLLGFFGFPIGPLLLLVRHETLHAFHITYYDRVIGPSTSLPTRKHRRDGRSSRAGR